MVNGSAFCSRQVLWPVCFPSRLSTHTWPYMQINSTPELFQFTSESHTSCHTSCLFALRNESNTYWAGFLPFKNKPGPKKKQFSWRSSSNLFSIILSSDYCLCGVSPWMFSPCQSGFPLDSPVSSHLGKRAGTQTGSVKLPIRVNKRMNVSVQKHPLWSLVQDVWHSCLKLFGPGTGSGFTTTLTRIKLLLKMNEWMYEWMKDDFNDMVSVLTVKVPHHRFGA